MILVTGGTGLIGSHLLLQLVQDHDEIQAIRRPTSNIEHVRDVFSLYRPDADELYEKIEWIEADIEDKESLLNAFEGIHLVYHCAGAVSFDPAKRLEMIRSNVQGTANLVNACLEKKINKLCFISSTSALGTASDGHLITEDMIWSASRYKSSYSISKFKSELEVWRGIAEGLKAVILNPSIIIGPGDWERSSARLFSVVWKGMKYFTEGVTGYVDVRDVVRAMIRLAEADVSGERFIVSADNISYRKVLEMIAEGLGKKPPIIRAGSFLIHIAWIFDWLSHIFTRENRSITREVIRSIHQKSFFSNEKIKKAAGLEFMTISDSIRDTSRLFLIGYK
jgi:nucleoside-diphosphate-sugar epimerase